MSRTTRQLVGILSTVVGARDASIFKEAESRATRKVPGGAPRASRLVPSGRHQISLAFATRWYLPRLPTVEQQKASS